MPLESPQASATPFATRQARRIVRRPRRKGPVFYALCANAALLLAILVAMVSRGNASFIPSALAAGPTPPIAGGGGIFLMPGQFSTTTWGCYIMDIDTQTLCA